MSALPVTQPAGAAAELAKMKSLMGRRRGDPRGDRLITVLKQRLPEALAVLGEMEQKYPKAKEIHEARMMGVVAAIQLARISDAPAMTGRAKEIIARIIASDAPGRLKLHADAHLLLLRLKPIGVATTSPAANPAKIDTTKTILQFTQRYAKTDQAVDAITTGMQMGKIIGDQKVFDELLEKLTKDHSDHPRAKRILRQLGKSPDIGKPFAATLTKLDGTKLTLPDDLRGKVVVIDFWATWCRPCIMTIPHMKSLYAKYKTRGVEIVGISLDKDLQRLKSFVATNKMDWIHACSGKGWDDPTAHKYGIGGIPSIWVIGKDGKVVSDNARRNLTATIEKALSATITKPTPTTRPARVTD